MEFSSVNVIYTEILALFLGYVLLIGAYRGQVTSIIGHTIFWGLIGCASASAIALIFEYEQLISIAIVVLLLGIHLFFINHEKNKQSYTSSFVIYSILIISISLSSHIFSLIIALGSVIWMLFKIDIFQQRKDQTNGILKISKSFQIILLSYFSWLSYMILVNPYNIESVVWPALVSILCTPTLVSGLFSLQKHSITVHFSRSMRFNSSILSICGAYLVVVGVGSYLIEAFISDKNKDSQITTFIVFIAPLIIGISSTTIRRWVRVKISQHIFAEQIDYRSIWLELTQMFRDYRSTPTQLMTPLTDMLEHECGAFLVEINGTWRVATTHNLPDKIDEFRYEISLAHNSLHNEWILDRDESIDNPSIYNIDVVSKIQTMKTRWLIPVHQANGLCAILLLDKQYDSEPNWINNWELRDYLNTIAQQLYWFFIDVDNAQHRSDSAHLSAFIRTSAFILHDLKNIASQLNMLSSNWEIHQNNPAFTRSAMSTVDSARNRLQQTIGRLQDRSVESNNCKNVSLEEIMQKWSQHEEFGKSVVLNNPKPDWFVNVDKDRMVQICNHLLRNAIDACANVDRMPKINIDCLKQQEYVKIVVSDNGCGMTDNFVKNELFKPLKTTKGSAGMGLGVYDAFLFAQQHGGYLDVDTSLNQGTTFTLTLPLITGIRND